MAHTVTCVECGEKFDRDRIPFIQVNSRRYKHEQCPPLEELEIRAIAKKWLGSTYNTKLVNKQINAFKEEGRSMKTTLKVLKYTIEIKKLSAEGARGGIGILPYLWEEAGKYYNKLEDVHSSLDNVDISAINKQKEISIKIKTPKRELIDLEELLL